MEGMRTELQTLKVVLLGNDGVGKTSLILTYITGKYFDNEKYIPLVTDLVTVENHQHKGKLLDLSIWDTSGGIDYYEQRRLSYVGVDVLVLVFSVVCESDIHFELMVTRWLEDVEKYSSDIPMVFVGSQSDLRETMPTKVLSEEKLRSMSRKFGAVKYMEVSSVKHQGVTELFSEVVRIGLRHNCRRNRSNCRLL